MNLFRDNNTRTAANQPLFPPLNSQPQPTSSIPVQQAQTNSLPQSNALLGLRPSNPQPNTLGTVVQQRVNQPQPTRKFGALNFKQICKQISMNNKAMAEIQKMPQFRVAMALGLQYFDCSNQKSQQYKRQHSGKQNFGFTTRQMGEQCQYFKCDKIDMFWRVLVQYLRDVCNVSELLISQYLRQYLVDNPIYLSKLTTKQFYNGSFTRMPNTAYLQTLFVNNYDNRDKSVSVQSQLFIQLFKQIQVEIYSEQNAMIQIMIFFMNHNRKFYKDVIKKDNCDYFTVMWKKYQKLSVLGRKTQLQANDDKAKKIKQFFATTTKFKLNKINTYLRVKVCLQILKQLTDSLSYYGSWTKQPKIVDRIDYKQAIKFIDSDLEYLDQAQLTSSEYTYILCSIDLLQVVIPMCLLSKVPELRPPSFQPRDAQTLLQSLRSTKSVHLQFLRFLAWLKLTPVSANRTRDIQQQWQKVTDSLQQVLLDSNHSGAWVGLVMQACTAADDLMQCERLFVLITRMVKKIVKQSPQTFWMEENSDFYYQLIRNCMRQFIIDKGVQPWLPVLTKCLGTNTQSSLTIKTLDYIGFDGLKREIKQSLMQNLDMSDRQASSSIRHSMFMSHHSTNSFMLNASDINQGEQVRIFDNYPEQQLKFLCRMIKNCKNNLQVVQERLFECQQSQSTCILVCKFLFQCLSKLRERKPSSLKCMRYIISTVNQLFANQPTRPQISLAISLLYSQSQIQNSQKSQNTRNQLYDMIDYACTNKSQSQLYRQSCKLRQVLCDHLCTIVKVSKYLGEYFPYIHQYVDSQEIHILAIAVKSRNYVQMIDWYNRNNGQIKYLSTPYFRTLLLLLQSPQLLPIDYETICTIVRTKLLVNKDWPQQYDLCRLVVDILNGGNILASIWSELQPTIDNKRKRGTNEPHFMFGLANVKFMQAYKAHQYLQSANQSVRQMRFVSVSSQNNPRTTLKRKKQYQNNINMATGRISGSLQLIGTLLHMHNMMNINPQSFTNSNNLILNLKLYTGLMSQVSNLSNVYHYSILMPPTTTYNSNYSFGNRNVQNSLTIADNDIKFIGKQDTVLVNFAMVVASLISFQYRMGIPNCKHINKSLPFKQPQIVGFNITEYPQMAQILKQYSVLNILDLDKNQLTMQSDYTIGVGNVLYVINQIITLSNHNNNNNSSEGVSKGVIWRLLTNWDVTGETSINTTCSKDISQFVNQILMMLDHFTQAKKIQCILQFLTLTCCHNPSLLFQIFNQKPATFPKLRRSFKKLLQQLQPVSDSINHSSKLLVLNKILLFVLAISQHRDRYPQEVQAFVKLPTNIVQDALEILPLMHRYLDRINDQRIGRRNDLNPQTQIVWEMRGLKQYQFQILYKGTVHICLQLYKRFYLNETASQNTQTLTKILLLSSSILSRPPVRQSSIISHYITPIRPQQHLHVQQTATPNLLLSSLPVSPYSYSSIYPPILLPFLPYISNMCGQYGRSYQYTGSQIYLKYIYWKSKGKQNQYKHVLQAYRSNYQSSYAISHQLMLLSYLGVLNIVCGVGPYGHILHHDHTLIHDNQIHTIIHQISQRSTTNIIHILDMYKIRGRYPPSTTSSSSSSLSLMPVLVLGQSAQNFHMLHRICTSLINYFQLQHSKQSVNDMLICTISSILRSMAQCLTPIHNELSHNKSNSNRLNQNTTRADVHALKRLTNFIMDSTKINKIRVTARVFIMLLVQIAKCWHLCDNMGVCCQQDIGKVTQIVQAIVAYCGNHIQNNNQVQIRHLQLIFNQNNLQDNIFLISLLLTSIVHHQSPSSSLLVVVNSSRIYTLRLICSLTQLMVSKYLSSPQQQCSLTNMAIMKLVHAVISHAWYQMDSKQQAEGQYTNGRASYDKQQRQQRIVLFGKISNKYCKFIIKGLNNGVQSPVWACWLIDGLINLLQFSKQVDSDISTSILQFMCTQFEISKTPSNQTQNDRTLSNDKTSLKSRQKHKLSSSSLYMSSMLAAVQWVPSLTKIAQLSSLLYLLGSVTAKDSYWTNTKYSVINQSIFNSIINQQIFYNLIQAVGSGQESGQYGRYNSDDRFTMDRILGCNVATLNFTQANWHKIELAESEDEIWQQPIISPYSNRNHIQSSLQVSKNTKRVTLFEFVVHVQVIDIIYTLSQILNDCLHNSNNLKRFYSKILKTTGKANFIDELVWDKITGLLLCCLQYAHKKVINLIRFYPKCVKKLAVLYKHCLNSTDMAYSTNFLSSCHLCNPFTSSPQSQSSISAQSLIGDYKSFVVNMILSLSQTCISFIEIWRADDWKSNINWESSRFSLIQTLNTVFRDCIQYVNFTYDQQQDQKIIMIGDWIQANLQNKMNKNNRMMDGTFGPQSIRNY